ncbi:MAG: vitamin B12 dependent-methionine synthase activation domain-containing protein, partial [Rhodospirillales bacterium]|nr:vitamin B12 dependent-methionine synthase activation domain-containing protein [Rhodospirillales bacterium]
LETIEALEKEFSESRIVVSLSGLADGLAAPVRQVIETVFVELARERGVAGVIGEVTGMLEVADIDAGERAAAEDLIFECSPLEVLTGLIGSRPAAGGEAGAALSLDDRLRARIVDGNRKGLEEDLAEAVKDRPALEIINETLLDGMKEVSELFSEGKMPLPFVLDAAETMKAAVTCLEPHMDTDESTARGTIVLATVKGDIHDIGKNLVDIILSNNGYRTVNLGAKQPIDAIMKAAREEEADAVGLSGLLVRSAVVMRLNLEEMRRGGLQMPVLLGGAALNKAYVQDECMLAYGEGLVAYAGDVFDGLDLMDKVMSGDLETHLEETATSWPSNRAPSQAQPAKPAQPRPVELEEIRLGRGELHTGIEAPVPPFWGTRLLESPSLETLLPLLNERVLFQFQWGFRKGGRSLEEWWSWAEEEVRPVLERITKQCMEDGILNPQAAYGYWQCASDGDAVVLYGEDGQTEAARFTFPRQARTGGLCIADFIRGACDGPRDVIGLQAVSMGQEASDNIRSHFDNDRYQDYLYLHGFSVEMAEALAEHVHQRIRSELGIGGDDAKDSEKLLGQGYRGARFSFGYPACPRLEDQAQILDLLGAGRIGITMSDEHQLHPELSTTALVIHHPQARYFSV